MPALEMSPSAAGLPIAPWPPRRTDKRPVNVSARDSFLDICNREKCDFAGLMKLNFELDIGNPAMKGKWPKIVNYYLRTKLGCSNLTPGGNYKFSGGETIYVPSSGVIDAGEIVIIGAPPVPRGGTAPIASPDKEAIKGGNDFEIKLFERPLPANGVVAGKVKIALKGKYSVLNSDAEGKAAFAADAIGAGIARKITDDISVQVGSKVKLKDIADGTAKGKSLLESLRENFEATLKGNLFKSDDKSRSISLEGGLSASAFPIVVKIAGQWEAKHDLGPQLGCEHYPVAVSAQLVVTFSLGLSPNLLRELGVAGFDAVAGAGGVALAMIGFIALGAFDAGRRMENADKVGLLSHYVTAYRTTITGRRYGDGAGLATPGSPEDGMAMKGRADAERDARASFGGFNERPEIVYFKALLMASAGQPGDRVNNAQRLLERMLWRRLEKQYPPLVAPVSAFN